MKDMPNMFEPLNFKKWIDDHRDQLKPPVGNKMIWKNRDFIVMVVGGPNERKDYHINEGGEFFYQLEGDINLRVMENGKPRDIHIREGEIYLLPPHVPHSPQRPANTIGLVIEHKRLEHQMDGFRWYCQKCNEPLYEDFFKLRNVETDLPPVFEKAKTQLQSITCAKCNHPAS